jgi:hypothetical protein
MPIDIVLALELDICVSEMIRKSIENNFELLICDNIEIAGLN